MNYALGPNPDSYTPPSESLAEKLKLARSETPIDSEEWDREWAKVEAEMKQRNFEPISDLKQDNWLQK